MCMICVDLIKQRMTITEAERNVGELVSTAKDDKEWVHYTDLQRAIEELDLDVLGEVLEEGNEDN